MKAYIIFSSTEDDPKLMQRAFLSKREATKVTDDLNLFFKCTYFYIEEVIIEDFNKTRVL